MERETREVLWATGLVLVILIGGILAMVTLGFACEGGGGW